MSTLNKMAINFFYFSLDYKTWLYSFLIRSPYFKELFTIVFNVFALLAISYNFPSLSNNFSKLPTIISFVVLISFFNSSTLVTILVSL